MSSSATVPAGITFRLLDNSDVATVKDFLNRYCIPPIWKYLGITAEEQRESGYLNIVEPCIAEGNSFGGFEEDGRLVGVLINTDRRAFEDEDTKERYQFRMPEKYSLIDRAYSAMFDRPLAELLESDRYWESMFACVSPDHAGKGIYYRLKEITYERAKDSGIKKVCSATAYSPYARKEIDPLGYRRIRRLYLPDFVDPVTGRKEFENIKYPHDEMSVHVRDVVGD